MGPRAPRSSGFEPLPARVTFSVDQHPVPRESRLYIDEHGVLDYEMINIVTGDVVEGASGRLTRVEHDTVLPLLVDFQEYKTYFTEYVMDGPLYWIHFENAQVEHDVTMYFMDLGGASERQLELLDVLREILRRLAQQVAEE